VVFVVDLNDTPRVGPSANLMTARSHDDLIRTDDSEGNFARNFLRFRYSLLIFVLVGGGLENVDVMISYIRKNLGLKVSDRGTSTEVTSWTYPGLEFCDFVISQRICLGDDGDKVNFGMKSTHKFDIEGLQPKITSSLREYAEPMKDTHA
jgi:hypothetical protein